MQFDLVLHNTGPDASVASIVETAHAADELGFRAVWLIDHLLAPRALPRYHRVFEPLVTLAHIGAITRRVRLGTGVMVLPLRNPFVVAKQVATLDVLSGGRAILGVGAGYAEPEFTSVHADFRSRGRRLDEALRLCRHLWSGSAAPFAGDYYDYVDGVFGPLPPQGAELALMIGGTSEAALARAARFGAMWQSNLPDPDAFRALVRRLRELPGGDRVETGTRLAYPGTVDAARAAVDQWSAAGAEHIALRFEPGNNHFEQMRSFAQSVGLSAGVGQE